jgi:hypothetical protein
MSIPKNLRLIQMQQSMKSRSLIGSLVTVKKVSIDAKSNRPVTAANSNSVFKTIVPSNKNNNSENSNKNITDSNIKVIADNDNKKSGNHESNIGIMTNCSKPCISRCSKGYETEGKPIVFC